MQILICQFCYQVHDTFALELDIWLKRGVDGFIIKGFHDMHTEYDATKLSIVRGWRKLLDTYETDHLDHKVLSIDSAYLRNMV